MKTNLSVYSGKDLLRDRNTFRAWRAELSGFWNNKKEVVVSFEIFKRLKSVDAGEIYR